ncbi:MAG: HlyD family efflux transporter periplasmic adaptor subunit [Candidatus Wallbacteria bacterium]|nr:HlyD family efflux transporter periplasmic adaptor subunit [Candidatus Wallbacteria bacterium]
MNSARTAQLSSYPAGASRAPAKSGGHVVMLGLLAMAVLAGCSSEGTGSAEELLRAGPAKIASTVEASCVLVPRSEKWVAAAFPAVIEWLAPEGSLVKRGEPVFRLDASENRRLLAEKQRERELAVLDRQVKDLELDQEEYGLKNRLEFGRGDLSVLEIQHDQLVHGADAAELVRLELARANSGRALANLLAARREKQPFAVKGFVSADEMATLAVDIAREELAGRVLELEDRMARRGGKPEEIVAAAREVALSKSALELVRVRVETFQGRRRENAEELVTKLAGLDAEIAHRKGLLAQAVATAPLDGVLVYGETHLGGAREEKVRAGARTHQGRPVVQVAQPGELDLELVLAHRDALTVRPGQPVTFELAAYPGKRYSARIVKLRQALSGTQTERWIFPVVPALNATAQVLERDPLLRLGMTCRSRIALEPRDVALAIPAAAVSGGRVQLAGGQWRAIETGIQDLDRIEVLRGLAGGELLRPQQAVGGAQVTAPRRVRVRRGRLRVTSDASGQLEAVTVRDVIVRELDGQAKVLWVARDGAAVKRGEVIARLEEQAFRDALAEKKLELETTEKERAVQLAGARAQAEKLGAELAVARQDLELATLEHALTERGKSPRERADLEHDLSLATLDLEAAQSRLQVTLELAAKGHAAASEVKELTAKRDVAAAARGLAQVKVELARAGATRAERKKAALRVDKARLSVELARQKQETEAKTSRLALSRIDLKLAGLKREVDRRASMMASATVTAPASGTVVLLEHWGSSGLQKTTIGDSISEGVPFLQVADLSEFRVVATVSEGAIAGVRPGLVAQFWHVQSPGQRYDARVERVAPIATERRRFFGFFSGDRVFEVTLSTRAASLKFQPGMTVACEIETDVLDAALLVPSEAVFAGPEGSFVRLAGGVIRPVTVVAVGKGEAAVKGELSEGTELEAPAPEDGA